jgi:hypothetical protein
MKFIAPIKKPKTWVWIIGIFLVIYHCSKLFALLGPPVIIGAITDADNAFSFSSFLGSMDFYLQEGSKHLNVDKSTLIAMATYSGVVATLFLIAAPFLLKCRNWARQLVLILSGIEVLVMVALGVYYNSLPSIDILVVYVISSIFLLWPSAAILFNKSHNIYMAFGCQGKNHPNRSENSN